MGRSWYLRRVLVVPVLALIIRAWWAGRYFSVTLAKDLYGQSEGESCLGMLQGSVEHPIHVGGGDILKENTGFFGNRTSACCLGVSPPDIWAMAIS